MRNTKYVLTQFCFYDRTGIQKMLEKQAGKGWLLEAITPFAWKYRRIEPKRIHFAVTYFPSASPFDPHPTAGEALYQEFAAHSGWHLAASNAQLQIFYSEAENPTPIETDPLVEVQTIHKAVKKSFLPNFYLLLAVAVMNLGLVGYRLASDFVDTLSSNTNLFTILCWSMLFLVELTEILSYYHWRRKALKAARTDGSFVETRNRNNVMYLVLVVLVATFILMLTSINPNAMVAGLASGVLILGVSVLVVLFSRWMKKWGFSKENNRNYTILATVVLSLGVSFLSVFLFVSILNRMPDEHVREEYDYMGMTFARYGDDLPLTVQELTGEENGDYSLYKDVKSSPVLSKLVARQTRQFGTGDGSDLRYVVVEVKWSFLFDACLNDYLAMYHDQELVDIFGNEFYAEFNPVDPTPWGADAAWQLYRLEEAEQEYLLCYGDRIVNFDFSGEPTAEQMALVAQVLGNEQNFENNENK